MIEEIISTENLLYSLVFLITFIAVYKGLDVKINDKKISLILSVSISLLAIKFLSKEQLKTIIEYNSFLSIIVLTLFPFIIIFWFVYGSNIDSTLRKIIWACYGVFLFFITQNKFPFKEIINKILITIVILTLLLLFLDSWIKRRIEYKKNKL